MMRCPDVQRALSALQDEAQGQPMPEGIRAHLADCPGCSGFAEKIQRLWELLELWEPEFQEGALEALRPWNRVLPLDWALRLRLLWRRLHPRSRKTH